MFRKSSTRFGMKVSCLRCYIGTSMLAVPKLGVGEKNHWLWASKRVTVRNLRVSDRPDKTAVILFIKYHVRHNVQLTMNGVPVPLQETVRLLRWHTDILTISTWKIISVLLTVSFKTSIQNSGTWNTTPINAQKWFLCLVFPTTCNCTSYPFLSDKRG